jgi:hypothetical protein
MRKQVYLAGLLVAAAIQGLLKRLSDGKSVAQSFIFHWHDVLFRE